MCGRYALVYDGDELARHMSKQLNRVIHPPKQSYERSYNVAPTNEVPIYFSSTSSHLDNVDNRKELNQPMDNISNEDTYHLGMMRWGFIPHWAKDLDQFKGYTTINARLESLKTSKLYGQSLSAKRCVVPISGYYEWKTPDSKSKTKSGKTPYYITRKSSGDVMYLAALYEYNKNLDLYTFSIITGNAPKNLKWLHSRMPCVLEPNTEAWNLWIENSEKINLSQEELSKLLKPSYDENKYTCYEVSKDVGKVANKGSYLIEPVRLSSGSTIKKESKMFPYFTKQIKDDKEILQSNKVESDEHSLLKKEEDTKETLNLNNISESPTVKEDEDKSSSPSKRKRKLNVIELLHMGKKKKV